MLGKYNSSRLPPGPLLKIDVLNWNGGWIACSEYFQSFCCENFANCNQENISGASKRPPKTGSRPEGAVIGKPIENINP